MVNANPPKKRSRRRALVLHLVRALVGVSVVVFLLHRYDFHAVFGVILGVDLAWLAAAWAVGLAAMFTFVYMQSIVFRPLGSAISPLYLLKVQFQQRFFAMFMPGGTAILVKWYKLSKPSGKPGMTLALMAFMRLLNVASIVSVTALAVFCDPSFPWPAARRHAPWVAAVVVLVPLALFSPWGRRALRRIVPRVRLPRRFDRFTERLAGIPRALHEFTLGQLVAVVVLSAVSQVCFILQQALCAYAAGIDLPLVTFGWLRALVAACSNLPITIAGLGLREASMASFLAYYDVPREQAIGYALLFFAAFPMAKGMVGGLTELVDLIRSSRQSHRRDDPGSDDPHKE